MLDWLGSALSAVGGKGKQLLADPNFLKYLGGAGSMFGQGASAGQALDPSEMISGQAEQGALGQILGGGSGGVGQMASGLGVAPSGQRMLPSGVASKLGSVLGGVPSAVGDVVEPVAEAVTGAVSPIVQAVPQAAAGVGGMAGGLLELLPQLAGGLPGMLGGGMPGGQAGALPSGAQVVRGGSPGLEGPIGGGMQRYGGGGGPSPTPIGTAGPDSVVTKQTADGTTMTVQTPSERNLSTFGINVPPESLTGQTSADTARMGSERREQLIGPWPGQAQHQAQVAANPMTGAYESWIDPDRLSQREALANAAQTVRPKVFGIEYGSPGQSSHQLPLQMGIGAATGGPIGGMLPLWKALLGM